MKFRAAPLLLALLSLPALAESDVEARVDAYLGSLDAPVKAEQWRALGPAAVAVLEQRALSSGQLPTIRARAAEALGWVGSATHGDKLLEVAAAEANPLIVRLSALRSAGRLLSQDRMKPGLAALLQRDPNPRVRATAADVLSERLGGSGCALVGQQLKAEKPDAQRLFTPALQRCEKTRTP